MKQFVFPAYIAIYTCKSCHRLLQVLYFLGLCSSLICTGCIKTIVPAVEQGTDSFKILKGGTEGATADTSKDAERSFLPVPTAYGRFQAHDELDDDGYPRDFLVTALQVKIFYYEPDVPEADAINDAIVHSNQPAQGYRVMPFFRDQYGGDASSFDENRCFKISLRNNKRVVVECLFVNGFDAYGDERYTRKRISFIHTERDQFLVHRIETDEHLANIEDNHYLASMAFVRPKCNATDYELIPSGDATFKWNFNGESRTGGVLNKYVLNDLSEIEVLASANYQYKIFQHNHFSDTRYIDIAQVTSRYCR